MTEIIRSEQLRSMREAGLSSEHFGLGRVFGDRLINEDTEQAETMSDFLRRLADFIENPVDGRGEVIDAQFDSPTVIFGAVTMAAERLGARNV